MTYTIAISNEKGGVGKTTTAVSLGAALADIGLEVLLVDLDAQANLTLALGALGSSSQPTIVNVLLESLPARKAVCETGIPRLKIIPSSSEMALAERYLPSRGGFEMTIARSFAQEKWDFDFILLDCPPFLGAITHNALMSSDLLMMPTQAEFFSVNALRNMMSLVRRIRTTGNPKLTYRLLITMFDRRNRIHRSLAEQLRTTFGSGVLETVIETDTRLRESPITGLPIIYHSPKSRSALQYRSLAQEILTYVKETDKQPA